MHRRGVRIVLVHVVVYLREILASRRRWHVQRWGRFGNGARSCDTCSRRAKCRIPLTKITISGCLLTESTVTYSKILVGFQVIGSAIIIELAIGWCGLGTVVIMANDCAAGESSFESPCPAEIGGVIGWLI